MATVNIKSAVRIRPLTEDEQAVGVSNDDIAVSIDGTTVLLRTPDEQTAAFSVNFAYAPEVTHQQIYGEMVAPLTLRVFDGYNASVITFGTTGSGKQYSLLGDDRDPGLIERAANDLFSRISSDQSKRYLVTFAMYQINKEFIVDLLNPVLDSGLELEQSRAFGCVLPGLAELIVHGADEVKELLQQGRKVMAALLRKGLGESPNLVTGALPNPSNTKPHFIAEIKVEAQQNGNFISPTVYSTFRFVCSAGSGGMAIDTDQSLKSLVTVVELLGAGRDSSVVPYSSSALTRILETNLGGNSSSVVLVAIDPLASSFEDSSRSLQFAEHSTHIANKPALNANTVLATIQELREEIRQTRGKLNLSDPSNYINEVDTSLLDRLKSLMTQLENTKNNTWEARIKRSQRLMEERKDNLNKAGLFIVLEEDVSADAELMRKVEKERRNLVLQTYVVEQKESKLVREQDTLQTLMRSGSAKPEEFKKSEEAINELTKTVTHQKEKLEKMKSNFAKYIAQLVELEERQRKTFLTAEESSRLHVAKDAEDWKEIEALKGGDPKLREKLKEVQSEHHMLLESIDSRYAEVSTVPVAVAKQLETAHASSQRQLKEKLEEMRWERDQLLGRLIERDFRHEVQMGRMQKQMFMVFREYRRHFEEQKSRMEMRYRQLLEDSIQDVLKLQSRNTELETQIERTNKERAFTLSQSSFASVAAAALANVRATNS